MKRKLIFIFAIISLLCSCSSEPQETQVSRVFLGDSITQGLAFFDLVPQNFVIGNAGATAEFAYKEVEKIAEMNPDQICIMLGQCDLIWPVDDPIGYSLGNYRSLIKAIQQELPNTEIYLQSITYVAYSVQSEKLNNRLIDSFNEAISSLAAELGAEYIDINTTDYSGMFDEDGYHFKKAFYDYWLALVNERIG